MLFQTLHLPNSKETWCPTSYFSPELSKRSTPSPPPSPSPVIVPGWPRANPAARSTSPAPCSVLSSSPALSARSSFTNTHEDWDEIDHFCVGNGPPEFAYQRCRLVLPPTAPPPRPLPNPYQINAQRPQDFNVMSDRELNLSIERRQRDIERTQLEISRKQSEISRAVADITEWVVELRHRREGPRSTWGAK
ncbi:hypothetical protein PISMIDRAFT_191749 [Pisolithus microcarpus 441]|uniref:Unplaced genomic scaffold scaffold_123, whole genome shotgun sequence n=1 Tax=Pisolithus microcarpus 441 TaxID=765257 RepID=A0A0C9YWP7_9AGAM|nr:hypothetical protein PISMIDRAFT_191749 [Pisolithus microcarpus 441]